MTTPASIGAPAGEPTTRRRFQLTNLDGNTNKYHMVETWPQPDGSLFFRAMCGRVGARPQIDERIATAEQVERKVREKQHKGYQEVALHRPAVAATAAPEDATLPLKIQQLVTISIMRRAKRSRRTWQSAWMRCRRSRSRRRAARRWHVRRAARGRAW